MITKEINIAPLQMKARIGSYVQLLKLRLTLLVVFSAAITFAYAAKGQLKWTELLLMILGGILTTGSANSLNQIIEKDTDKLMHRTQNRPMPTYKLSTAEALTFAISIGVAGIFILTTTGLNDYLIKFKDKIKNMIYNL